jgi:hypothetical protein
VASCFFALCQSEFWSYRRSAGRYRQSGGRFHVDRGVDIPVVDRAAGGTRPLPDIEGLGSVLDAVRAGGVPDRLIGDYNDCSAYIGGDVRTGLFYGEEHHFTIGGALSANAVIGQPRLEIATPPAVIDIDDLRMLDHFDRDLLRVFDDHDDNGNTLTYVDGFDDFRELKRRVRAGLPFRAAETRDN